MALNFPNSPIAGDKVTLGGRKYQYSGAVWSADDSAALLRNRIVNPAMTISQEWGNTASSSVAALSALHTCDQWFADWTITGTTMSTSLGAVNTGYPIYPCRFFNLTTAAGAASVPTGDFAQIRHIIEGQRVADFLWGTPNAKPIIIKLWLSVSYNGTYSMVLRGATHSYAAPLVYTAAPNFQQFTISVPGPTVGTWNTDNTAGLELLISPRMGANWLAPSTNTWLGALYNGFTGMNNFCASGASGFNVAQVEMYLDPFNTGVAPRFVFPDYAEELRKCQRYWYRGYGARGVNTNTDRPSRMTIKNPVYMRVPPAITLKGTVGMYSTQVTANAIGIVGNTSSVETVEVGVSTSAVFVTGRVACQYFTAVDNYFAVSARM
jgi:hypothetical protein